MAVSTAVMTMEEFIRRSDQEGPFEIINGEIVSRMPTVFGHGEIANLIGTLLNQLAGDQGKAYVEVTFIYPDDYDANWVRGSRIPDVMFIRTERLDAYKTANPDWRGKPLMLVPDLVVEVVSPTDQYSDVQAKVQRYLADGVRLVWVFDPQTKTVTAYSRTQEGYRVRAFNESDTLDGGDVIAGLSINLKEIFEG
jgi:Uma2 family endonuclease